MQGTDGPMSLEQRVIDLEGQIESLEADLAEARHNLGRFKVCATEARAEIEAAELDLITAKQNIDEMPKGEPK